MDFPHLKDNQFPIIDNVNVYKYQNNFDYARWNGRVSYKLLNVLWNSNYADVPYFETEKERDEWFENKDGYVGTLKTLFNNTPTDRVKIDVPYNVAYKYNYLVVDMPMQTSIDNPINFENEEMRIKRWFFFIEDMEQNAPSTTELRITVDYWTTFIHSVEIPYLMLERGHAPMTQIKVDDFLNNPIMNNEFLLANDFNYGDDTIIKTSAYKPIGNGKKYVLFCAPYNMHDFYKFETTKWSGDSTPPTYANEQNRWGEQLIVNNYDWKYGEVDYNNSDLPIANSIQTGILSGCDCFAIEGIYAQEFFNKMARECVNFIHGIQAIFMLDESLFDRTEEFEFYDYTLYVADRKLDISDVKLNKHAFGFDEKYSEITKLYTSPYSYLEITDDDGNNFTAKIENTGNVKMHTEVALVYPYLSYNVFFSGINGDGTMNYTWRTVYESEHEKTMWASDFAKYMMNWNIPTYALYVNAEDEFAVNNFANMEAIRAGAIKDYKNAVRYANTTYENIAATQTTNEANVNRSTDANKTMTNRTQAGLVANMQNENTFNETVTDDLQNKNNFDFTQQVGDSAAENAGFNVASSWYNYKKVRDDAVTDWSVMDKALDQNVQFEAGMAANNIGTGLFLGAVQAGATSINGGLSLLGGGGVTNAMSSDVNAGVTIVSAGANAVNTAVATFMTISRDSALTGIQQTANGEKLSHSANQIQGQLRAQIKYGHALMDANNTLRETEVNRFSKADTGINNQNAKTAKDANDANAQATKNTETANADYNRDANIEAEKANLVQKQLEAENAYKNARLQVPTQYGKYGGTFSQDIYMRRGVRLNIRTQTKSAIAQAGDAFLRFGYALHRVWDMKNGFHYGKEFTFWKAEDIWINDGSGVANIATNSIGEILLKGVTVWRNPDKIGFVSIYDNI